MAEKVNRMVPAEIQRVAFGVRYGPHLRVIDSAGAIMDEILRTDGSPFGPEVFPFNEASPVQYRLVNPETGSDLIVNSQDTILQLVLETHDASRINEAARDFEEYVLEHVRRLGGVNSVVRYGVAVHFKENKDTALKNAPVAKYVPKEFPRTNSLFMRFTRRIPAEEALAKRRVDDYRSAIYAVEQGENGDVVFSIDYQDYYTPPLDAKEFADRSFAAFVDRGTEFIESEFQKWLAQFAEVA
jgi:hypothetical protein